MSPVWRSFYSEAWRMAARVKAKRLAAKRERERRWQWFFDRMLETTLCADANRGLGNLSAQPSPTA